MSWQEHGGVERSRRISGDQKTQVSLDPEHHRLFPEAQPFRTDVLGLLLLPASNADNGDSVNVGKWPILADDLIQLLLAN